MLLSPGWSERAERAFIEEYMPPTGVFLDIGAHAGYYTFFVAGRRSKSRIVSIEPVHDYVVVLEFNRRLNGLDRVAIEEVALSDREGTAQFNRATESMVLGAGTGEVRTTTLLQVLASHHIHAIDCMKIDVEGAEDRVLMPFFRSSAKSLWPKTLLIEHACRTHWKGRLGLCTGEWVPRAVPEHFKCRSGTGYGALASPTALGATLTHYQNRFR